MLLGKLDESAGRVSSMVSLVLRRSGIFFLLAFALLAQSAWGQRIGPLGPLARQQLKAQSSERAAAAVRPPSLRLSLPPPTVAALPPLGPTICSFYDCKRASLPSSVSTVSCRRGRSH